MQSESTLKEKIQASCSENCLGWLFRKKVTEAEEVSQLGCMNSGNNLQRQKRGP